ncbi:MAG: hypothetical protein ACU84Q_08225 [Gammaproteobacteria bacterium]
MKYDDVTLWHRASLSPKYLFRYKAWRADHRQAIKTHRTLPDARPVGDHQSHLNAAVTWLLSCQDISADGGFVGRYRLDKGWTTSYPETTGYIIPTLLSLADADLPEQMDFPFGRDDLRNRAVRAADFLLSIQLDSGAFPAGEIGTNTQKPSPFNSAQIINGLHQMHAHCNDTKYLDAAIKAANWLLDVQDDDGAWRQWFYHSIPATYCSHLSCWIAELGVYIDNEQFLSSARANAQWILAQQDDQTGFFDKCGFTEEEQNLRIADLHTIAYNQAGLIRIARALNAEEIYQAVEKAALAVLETLNRLSWLPGMLDYRWQSKANSACLTGCAQMALVWMDLYEKTGDERHLRGAQQAVNLVKQGQIMESDNPSLRGAIPGSDPLWGWYNDGIMPNWAAKFFIDALLQLQRIESS